jgi:Reverse transcriptase (RNA-dependent DNA polymerase)
MLFKCKIIRFADDIVILISGPIKEIEVLLEVLRRDVEVVCDFHEINEMKINPKKSSFMLFHHKAQRIALKIDELRVNDEITIKRVSVQKYLGIQLDENVSMEEHIKKVEKKIEPAVRILSILKWRVPKEILIRIYFAHFHSHLYYMPTLFCHAKRDSVKRLQTLQNKAVKHAHKLPALTSSADLYTTITTNILPVQGIAIQSVLSLIHKIRLRLIKLNIDLPVSNRGRSSGDLVAARFSSDFLKRDISYFGIKAYNALPKEIKQLTEINSFKSQTKVFLRNHFQELLDSSLFTIIDRL